MVEAKATPQKKLEIQYSLFGNTVGKVVAGLEELPVGGVIEVRTNDP